MRGRYKDLFPKWKLSYFPLELPSGNMIFTRGINLHISLGITQLMCNYYLKRIFLYAGIKKKNKDIKTYQWTLRKRTYAPEYWVLEMIYLKTSLATLGKISGTRGRRTNCHSCFPPENGSYIYSQFRFGNCYGKWNTHCFFEIVIVKTFPCLSAENHIQ